MRWRLLTIAGFAWLAFALASADATSNHTYRKGEYALIHGGHSPDKRHSLATHGEDELGYGNFHVYLMAEPGHRKIAPLPDIDDDNILDTGPDANWAAWSRDSRAVAVSYRVERHIMETKPYRTEGTQVRRTTGPSAFKAATGRDLAELEDDHVFSGAVTVNWTEPKRFLLMERYRFRKDSPDLARTFDRFGKAGEPEPDGVIFVEFSAEATCELLPDGHYRILGVKPGSFGE
jgi:hypothetical protein